MERRFISFIAATLIMGSVGFAQSSTWTIDKNHTQVDFQIRHAAVSNVHGMLNGVSGTFSWDEKDLSKSHVDAVIDAATITTNNDGRDKHLKSPDFFNVEKYPTLSFKSTSVTRANGKLQIVGDLTLAGVTKSVTLDVDGPTPPQKGMQGGMVMGFSASGVLKRSDFNFGQKYTSPLLGDDVKFTLDLEGDQK